MILLAFVLAASAGKISVRAEVSTTRVAAGETFTLDITVVSSGDDPVYTAPDFENLEILRRGTSHSQSFQMVMGSAPKVQRSTVYQYVLQPQKTGTAKIGSASARVGNDLASSDPITIDVGAGSAPAPAQAVPKLPPGQKPEKTEPVMLRVIPDKFEAYVGEQVVLSVFLLARVELSDVNNLTQPQLEGVLLERDDKARTNLVPRVQRFGNEEYNVFEIARFALFALKEGPVTVGGFQMEASGGVSFFSHGKTYRVTSPPIELHAKPLPAQGRPNNFTAMNVGDLQFNATLLGGGNAQVGKPVTLRMVVTGVGNPTKVQLPTPAFSDKMKAYDPETKSEQRFEQGQLAGKISRDHLFVVLQPGQHVLPAVVFNSFDPRTGTYREQRAGPFTINVGGEAAPEATAVPVASGPEGRTLHPMRYTSSLLDDRPRMQTLAWVWGGSGTTGLAALALVARRVRRREKSKEEISREARVKASRALKSVRGENAYGDINRIIRQYLLERFGVSLGTPRESLRALLREQGADDKALERLMSELDNCDFARFAPGGGSNAETQAACERVDQALGVIDRAR